MQGESVDIPMDMYESNDEIFIVIPLGGVDRQSVEVFVEKTTLLVTGERKSPQIKENMQPVQQDCFWGGFNKNIELPQNVYFQQIYSKLTENNILEIIVPKVVIPEKVKVDIDYK